MCGIMGFYGISEEESAGLVVLKGLQNLEYRGYDSSGIAYYNSLNNKIESIKRSGKLANLSKEILCGNPLKSGIAIGHIRWATHGKPTNENAHPHLDCTGNIAIVHNGIIENYIKLKGRLLKNGHKFITDTDSEVIAHLIEDYILQGFSFSESVRRSALEMKGSFAVAILYAPEKRVAAVKYGPPLVLAQKGGNLYFASDISPLLEYTGEVIYLKNSEIAYFNDGVLDILSFGGKKVKKKVAKINWDASKVAKSGFSHFMQKEIYEQPSCILDAFSSRIVFENNIGDNKSSKIVSIDKNKNIAQQLAAKKFKVALEDLRLTKKDVESAQRIVFVACGSSYYASLISGYIIESLCGLPAIVHYGSEFRYGSFPVKNTDIVVGISQSGETADTNSALELALAKKAKVVSICNVPGSQITAISNKGVIYTHAGPEIGVASTKAFTSQILCGLLLALFIRQYNGFLPLGYDPSVLFKDIVELPQKIEKILLEGEKIRDVAKKYYKSPNFLYLGRGILYPIALEGALKLKEISYIHAEGYPAGEMKHGPIAIIDENMPVMFLLSNNLLSSKTVSNIEEIKARDGIIITISDYEPDIEGISDAIKIPETSLFLSPILYAVPLQLFAYHIALLKGTDIDQPRNLAKSVTVE